MRRLFLGLAMAMIGVLAQAQESKALQVQEFTLSNGMKVWLNEDHAVPQVFGAVVVNAGAKDCPNTGIAHYFEHILFKGTDEIGTVDYSAEKPWLDSISAKYDKLASTKEEAARLNIQHDISRLSQKASEYAIPNEFNRLISRYGGSQLNAGTSYDFTFYHNKFIPQYIEQWCILNSDRLIHPVFRLFQGELETVYEEKNMYSDNLLSTAREAILAELFGTRPYAYPIIGSTENLKNPRLSEMQAFYDKYYVASNMGLVLCGDIDRASILPLLERTFGRIRQGDKPTRVTSALPDITTERTVDITLPIPLVNAEGLIFKGCTQFEPDANALKMAMQLLSNGNAGLLDSLTNEGTVMAGLAADISLNDAGICALIIIPNLLSKTAKAEAACLAQAQKIITGDFSEANLNELKAKAQRDALQSLETLESRAEQMVSVMSTGHSWQEYLQSIDNIGNVTHSDVAAAAKRYLGKPFVRFKKKYGNYDKDKVRQPDYKPVTPRHKGAESTYAQRLKEIPTPDVSPRLIDFEKDATKTDITPYCHLYTVDNPYNNLFELTLHFNTGLINDPRLDLSTMLLNTIGTDSLTRQQFGKALQRLGADIIFDVKLKEFTIKLTGTDQHFEESLQLLSQLMKSTKCSKKDLKKIRDTKKADDKSFGEDNQDVMSAALEKTLYGPGSTNLTQVSAKEAKKMGSDEMLAAFSEALTHDCLISYSGTLNHEAVLSAVKANLPCHLASKPYKEINRELQTYNEPVVYFYDMPKSRQTLFATYDKLKPMPTIGERVPLGLLNRYFGGSMSSVLFQEVREFRSMAYSTHSMTTLPSLSMAGDKPGGFITVLGTQGDKSMSAISLVDSLLHDMPVLEANFEGCRQECINSFFANYPNFREIGEAIGDRHRKGLAADNSKKWTDAYQQATIQDMTNYYRNNIQNNASHRAMIVVGNKKSLDMQQLSQYGKVVMLKKKDIKK